MVIMMIFNPDLIESTTVDDKPTVKRYVHRETGVAYISYYHHSNGVWTTPFIEGSVLDIRSRDICEDDALHCDGAIPNSANGGIVEKFESKLAGETPLIEDGATWMVNNEPLFPPKEKKEIKPIGRGIRIREKDNQADPDINSLHPVDRANYEREQLQALGESLSLDLDKCCEITQEERLLLDSGDFNAQELFGSDGIKTCPICHDYKMNKLRSGFPPLAPIGQPISCERVTPEYWIIEQDGIRMNVTSLAPAAFSGRPYTVISHVPEKREPISAGHPVSLTGDPVEITSLSSGGVKDYAPGLRDDSRCYPGDFEGSRNVIDGLRGQVKQLREELGYANDEANQARASLDTAILLKNQYHDKIKRLEGDNDFFAGMVSKLNRENCNLQSGLNKWRNHAEIQHRTMLASAVLLIFVFVGLCLGW